MASEAFVNESLMGFSGAAATAFFVTGAEAFFTRGVFAFSTGVTAFFGAVFAAAFVALVVAMDSSSLIKGWPETFAFAQSPTIRKGPNPQAGASVATRMRICNGRGPKTGGLALW